MTWNIKWKSWRQPLPDPDFHLPEILPDPDFHLPEILLKVKKTPDGVFFLWG
jgi:hypothetical protein